MFDENEEYEDEYYENHKDEKEVIEGYTVQSSVNVGNRRIIYAKDETETMEMPYMKCVAYENLLFTRYENGVISDTFEEIMKLYADEIRDAALVLEQENEKRGASHLPPFRYSDLISDTDKNLVGKVAAINSKYLLNGYKTMPYQLFLVTGGNGANENHYGNACLCNQLYTGQETRIERYEVLGIVPDDKLPDFARVTLEKLREEKTRKGGER